MSGKNDKKIRKAVRDYGKDGVQIVNDWLYTQLTKPLKFRLQLAWTIIKGLKRK